MDIGDHSTYISVARLGAVETISNDYSLRATPSIVAFGERQRFIGVSAENQRNLNPKNTVSFFKNTLGLKVKSVESLATSYGAKISLTDSGKLTFEVRNRVLESEQALAMLLTKVKELVRESEGEEELETCVISVPIYFTQAQRQAVVDAATIAGLRLDAVITDMAALALSYGTGRDFKEEETRNVVFIDSGCEGTQVALAQVSKKGAKILASSANHIGGKVFDQILVEFALKTIEEKYKKNLKDNAKAVNKVRNALEKAKKQMSANTNSIPVQLDSLVDDIDVAFSVDRAKFQELIQSKVAEMKETFENLLASTTVKPDQIHSVEIVGGSTRIPIVKSTIQQVFGKAPSTTLNADEEVSRGCARHAASISPKFLTTRFSVEEVVHYGLEAMFVSGGTHEKTLIFDEGESREEERPLEIKADFPLNIALQYVESSGLQDQFVALYKVEKEDTTAGLFNLKFKFNKFGLLDLTEAVLVSESRKRRSPEPAEDGEYEMAPCRIQLSLSKSMPEPLKVEELARQESTMVTSDRAEIARQEEKNRLEEQLYQYRSHVMEHAELLEGQEAFENMKQQFDDIETWLYEEGEEAPQASYTDTLESLKGKMKFFSVWLEKFQQMKALEEEKKRFLEQQESARSQRQIPIVYEGEQDYVPKGGRGFAHRPDPFQQDPFQRADPFARFGRPGGFLDGFGW